jgi:serine protease
LIGTGGIAADFNVKPLNTTKGKPAFIEDELLVKFHPNIPAHAIARFNQTHGATIIANLPFGISRLKIPKGKSPETMAAIYRKNPNVQMAHPNYIAYAAMTPNDEHYPFQWNFDNPINGGLKMEGVWDETNAGLGTIVAVLDTGIAYKDYGDYRQAPDFSSTSFVQGYDFINNDIYPNDDNGHGTHVAGTIAQSTNDSYGTAGMAFKAALMPLKVLNANGSGSMAELIEAFDYILKGPDHVDVINMSLGFIGTPDPNDNITMLFEDALEAAYEKGIIIVAASGNDGYTSLVSYPASHPYVIAVGATDFYKNVTYYSNQGPELELTAPGGTYEWIIIGDYFIIDAILQQSFYPGDPTGFDWHWLAGTSMATPHVSATAALVKEADPSLSAAEVRTILQVTAEDRGPVEKDSAYGYGIVNPYEAILLAKSTLEENTPPTLISIDILPSDRVEDEVISFSAEATDADGDDLLYQWNIDGQIYTGTHVSHTFRWGGEFSVELIVDDLKADGRVTDQQSIFVQEVNDEPLLVHNGPYSAQSGENITFDASQTSDYDNEDGTESNDQTLTFHWEFGDGSVDNGSFVTHSYSADAIYDVTVSVNDTGFEIDTISQTTTATIETPDAVKPVITLLGDNPVTVETGSTYIDAGATANDNVDGNLTAAIVTVSTVNTTIAGTYTVTYDVLDNAGNAAVQVVRTVIIETPVININAPTGLVVVSVTGSTVNLSWSDNSSNEAGFKIERAQKIRGKYTFELMPEDSGENNSTFSNVVPEIGTYKYRVYAYNGAIVSEYSNEVLVKVEESTPPPPSGLVAPTNLSAKLSRGTETVALSWNDSNGDNVEFIIERSSNGSTYSVIATVTDTTSYIDDLNGETGTFYYQVKAYKDGETSDASNVKTIRKR